MIIHDFGVYFWDLEIGTESGLQRNPRFPIRVFLRKALCADFFQARFIRHSFTCSDCAQFWGFMSMSELNLASVVRCEEGFDLGTKLFSIIGGFMKKLLLGLLAFGFLTACETSIKDGKVPAKYISEAQKYVGTYHGEFEGRQMDLTLAIRADGLAVLSVRDLNGSTELINRCNSKIGNLISANVGNTDNKVKSVSFSLDRGNCRVEGRQVTLELSGSNQINAYVVETTRVERSYDPPTCYFDGISRHCFPGNSRDEVVPNTYLIGKFSK